MLSASFLTVVNYGLAQEVKHQSTAALAMKLANPLASMIRVPFQNDLDVGIDTLNASINTLSIDPVVPINISGNLIVEQD